MMSTKRKIPDDSHLGSAVSSRETLRTLTKTVWVTIGDARACSVNRVTSLALRGPAIEIGGFEIRFLPGSPGGIAYLLCAFTAGFGLNLVSLQVKRLLNQRGH